MKNNNDFICVCVYINIFIYNKIMDIQELTLKYE